METNSVEGSTSLTFKSGGWSAHEGFSLHACNCFSKSTSKDVAFLGTEITVFTPSSFASLLSCDCYIKRVLNPHIKSTSIRKSQAFSENDWPLDNSATCEEAAEKF